MTALVLHPDPTFLDLFDWAPDRSLVVSVVAATMLIVSFGFAGYVLAESFVGLLELTDDPDALREHHRNASQMVKVVPVALAGTEKFRDSLENVRRQRIQQHLSLAIARTRGIVVRIEAALVITRTTCEKVITIADAKLAQAKPPVSVTSP
jgi:hypothetical protein